MWSHSTFWWFAMGGVVILELLTGSIYLLMVALGFGAGGVTALLGAPLNVQLLVAAIVAIVAVALCHRYKRAHSNPAVHARADRSVLLDVGEQVQVPGWQADFTAEVRYRGATWTALLHPNLQSAVPAPGPGFYRVVELVGNRLVVEPVSGHIPPGAAPDTPSRPGA